MPVYKTSSSGGGALSVSHAVPAGATYQAVSVSVNLDVAPTTSASLTITLDAVAGSEYDTLLYSVNPSVGSITDIMWWPDQPTLLWPGDAVTVAYSNPDSRTYGVQITVREA